MFHIKNTIPPHPPTPTQTSTPTATHAPYTPLNNINNKYKISHTHTHIHTIITNTALSYRAVKVDARYGCWWIWMVV